MYTDPMPKEIFQAGIKSAGVENARLIYKGLKSFADESKAEVVVAKAELDAIGEGDGWMNPLVKGLYHRARHAALKELMDIITEAMKGEDK